MREPIEFEADGVRVTVRNRTPRTDMRFRSILVALSPHFEAFADEYDATINEIDIVAYEYAMLCSRVQMEPLVFPITNTSEGKPADDFRQWMETDYMSVVLGIRDAIRTLDAPSDPVTAPAPPDDAKKKQTAKSGN